MCVGKLRVSRVQLRVHLSCVMHGCWVAWSQSCCWSLKSCRWRTSNDVDMSAGDVFHHKNAWQCACACVQAFKAVRAWFLEHCSSSWLHQLAHAAKSLSLPGHRGVEIDNEHTSFSTYIKLGVIFATFDLCVHASNPCVVSGCTNDLNFKIVWACCARSKFH